MWGISQLLAPLPPVLDNCVKALLLYLLTACLAIATAMTQVSFLA